MKALLFSLVSVLCILTSCDNSGARDNQKQELPKALEDKSSSYSLDYKRGHEDLVESLYKELAGKHSELKELENRLENLNESSSDSAATFTEFDSKNQSYYKAANRHIEYVNDSLLKHRLTNLINASLAKYNSSISPHTRLLDAIEVKHATLNDLHTILKITKTLPLIEKYQKDNMPSAKPLEGYVKTLDETIRFADTLTKK
jgi:hypothetical protein